MLYKSSIFEILKKKSIKLIIIINDSHILELINEQEYILIKHTLFYTNYMPNILIFQTKVAYIFWALLLYDN